VEPEYQLFRVSGGRRLSDGRIALVNAGSNEVRVYGADGAYSHAFGKEGEGPGEYGQPTLVGVVGGDSLVVYDFTHRRVSIVHVDEGFVRSFPVGQDAGGFPVPNGMFRDGSQVYGGGIFFSSSDGGFPTGVIQNASKYAAVDLDGVATADYGEWPSFEMYARVLEGGGFTARSLPFAKGSSATTGPDYFYIGDSETYEIQAYDRSGSLVRIIRLDREPRSVARADIDRYREDELEDSDTPNEARAFEALMAEMPIPDRFPVYSSFKVDVLGYLWVSEYAGPRVRDPEWTIFDPDGHIVGKIRTPDRTQILEIGEDYILGRLSDELDVEYVKIWELFRPRAG